MIRKGFKKIESIGTAIDQDKSYLISLELDKVLESIHTVDGKEHIIFFVCKENRKLNKKLPCFIAEEEAINTAIYDSIDCNK